MYCLINDKKRLKCEGENVIFDLELPDGCPKTSVGERDVIAYRIIISDAPVKKDLETYLELGKLLTADTCKRGSVSLYETLPRAQHQLALRPYLGKCVASIQLTTRHGRVGHPSSSGHIDWWPYAGMRNPSELKVAK